MPLGLYFVGYYSKVVAWLFATRITLEGSVGFVVYGLNEFSKIEGVIASYSKRISIACVTPWSWRSDFLSSVILKLLRKN
jgi:hypothetical protein